MVIPLVTPVIVRLTPTGVLDVQGRQEELPRSRFSWHPDRAGHTNLLIVQRKKYGTERVSDKPQGHTARKSCVWNSYLSWWCQPCDHPTAQGGVKLPEACELRRIITDITGAPVSQPWEAEATYSPLTSDSCFHSVLCGSFHQAHSKGSPSSGLNCDQVTPGSCLTPRRPQVQVLVAYGCWDKWSQVWWLETAHI